MKFQDKATQWIGFTILELLVATAVLSLILVVMLSLITQTSSVWRSSSARIEAFQSARRGFENLTRSLEQATLNTYWDYDNPSNPTIYRRKSTTIISHPTYTNKKNLHTTSPSTQTHPTRMSAAAHNLD